MQFILVAEEKSLSYSPLNKCRKKTTFEICAQKLAIEHPTILRDSRIYLKCMFQINGSIMVASIVEVLLGLFGIIGLLLKYIGPLCICPTISLLGVSLFRAAAEYSAHQWWIALT